MNSDVTITSSVLYFKCVIIHIQYQLVFAHWNYFFLCSHSFISTLTLSSLLSLFYSHIHSLARSLTFLPRSYRVAHRRLFANTNWQQTKKTSVTSGFRYRCSCGSGLCVHFFFLYFYLYVPLLSVHLYCHSTSPVSPPLLSVHLFCQSPSNHHLCPPPIRPFKKQLMQKWLSSMAIRIGTFLFFFIKITENSCASVCVSLFFCILFSIFYSIIFYDCLKLFLLVCTIQIMYVSLRQPVSFSVISFHRSVFFISPKGTIR